MASRFISSVIIVFWLIPSNRFVNSFMESNFPPIVPANVRELKREVLQLPLQS